MGSNGSGSTHGSTRAGRSLADRVSDVSACDELADEDDLPGDPAVRRAGGVVHGVASGPTRSSRVVVGVPLDRRAAPLLDELAQVPRDVHGSSARSVPENTRTSESRPT